MDESNFLEEIRNWEHPPWYGNSQSEEEVKEIFGESEGSLPPRQDSYPDASEAINDFGSMSRNFIFRHHVEPRVKLYSPREGSFPIPVKYIDVSLTVHTNLDVKQEKRIDDYWKIDGARDLSDSWTGFNQFTFCDEKPPDGYMWSGRRLTKRQVTSRPDHLWPMLWIWEEMERWRGVFAQMCVAPCVAWRLRSEFLFSGWPLGSPAPTTMTAASPGRDKNTGHLLASHVLRRAQRYAWRASRFAHGSSIETQGKPRAHDSDHVWDVQRARHVLGDPDCLVHVRFGTDDRHYDGFWLLCAAHRAQRRLRSAPRHLLFWFGWLWSCRVYDEILTERGTLSLPPQRGRLFELSGRDILLHVWLRHRAQIDRGKFRQESDLHAFRRKHHHCQGRTFPLCECCSSLY